MVKSNQQLRAGTSPAGIRAVVAAASVAATMGGWAIFSWHDANQAAPAPASADPAPPQGQVTLQLPPPIIPALPTLVPAPAFSIEQLQAQIRAQTQAPSQAQPPAQVQATATATPVPTRVPVAAQPPARKQQPVLRSVNPATLPGATRRPVTTSRSSRP